MVVTVLLVLLCAWQIYVYKVLDKKMFKFDLRLCIFLLGLIKNSIQFLVLTVLSFRAEESTVFVMEILRQVHWYLIFYYYLR